MNFLDFLQTVDRSVLCPATLRSEDGRMCILGAAYDACGGDWSYVTEPSITIGFQPDRVHALLKRCLGLGEQELEAIEMAFDTAIRISMSLRGKEWEPDLYKAFKGLSSDEQREAVESGLKACEQCLKEWD